jgi:hypothetical protein
MNTSSNRSIFGILKFLCFVFIVNTAYSQNERSLELYNSGKEAIKKNKFKKFEIYHSDEPIPGVSSKGIFANPEPKTDIVIVSGGKKYFVSVSRFDELKRRARKERSKQDVSSAPASVQ